MSMNLSEVEFRKLGLAIDPDDPSRAVPIASMDESLPDESWDLDRLARYASAGLAKADRLMQESIQIGRRSTVEIFRSGRALSIARRRLKAEGWGRWTSWLNEHGIKRTTAWEAAELFERAGSEDKVAHLMPGEAKRLFWIISPPRDEPNGSSGGVESDQKTQTPSTPSAKSPSKVSGPPAKRGNEGGKGDADAVGQTIVTGAIEGQATTQPAISPEKLITTLNRVVQLLEVLEGATGQMEWRGVAGDAVLQSIDEGIECLNRLRECVVSHTA